MGYEPITYCTSCEEPADVYQPGGWVCEMCEEEAANAEPCTPEAYAHGCSCHVPPASPVAIDPPDPKLDKNCPLHGQE